MTLITASYLPVRRHTLGARINKTLAQTLCLVYFANYVATNASTDYEPSTSPAKHIVILLIAVLAVLSSPRKALFSLMVFSPVVALYAYANLLTYALMASVFALALPVIGNVLEDIISRRSTRTIALLFIIALLPALFALSQGNFENIWSYQYTRGRLLMGYWHPKEAAASFALPMLLYFLVIGKEKLKGIVLMIPLMLWVVGSRNVSLVLYLFIGLWKFPKTTTLLMISITIGFAIFLLLSGESLDLLNEITSLRLEVWTNAMSDPAAVAGDDLLLGNRLAIDSFYIEILVSAGFVGLLIFILWAASMMVIVGARRYRSETARPLLVSMLFFAAFDSGIISTGNILHIILWGLATGALFRTRGLRRCHQNSPQLQHAPVTH